MEEQSDTGRVVVVVVEGRRQRARQKLRWEDGVMEDGVTENGVQENGVTEDGVQEDGVTEDGVQEDCVTEYGVCSCKGEICIYLCNFQVLHCT